MKFLYPVVSLLLFCVSAFSQAPSVVWSRAYGGPFTDSVYNLFPMENGGLLMCATSSSIAGDVIGNHGNFDAWIVKTNPNGSIAWQRSYGGTQNEGGYSLAPTPDGGFFMGGAARSTDGDVTDGNNGLGDVWVFKADAAGNIVWQKTLGGTQAEYALDIVALPDGGAIAMGPTSSTNMDVTGNHGDQDYWLIRFSATGTVLWKKTFGGSFTDTPNRMLLLPSNEIVICGVTSSNNGDVSGNHGSFDGWVIKVDLDGNMIWQHCYGGPSGDNLYDIKATQDGNLILCGFSQSSGGDIPSNMGSSDTWILKIDTSGTILWQKHYAGTGWDQAHVILPTADAGYLVGFASSSSDGDFPEYYGGNGPDVWLAKLDASGEMVWTTRYAGSDEDYPDALVQFPDGSYALGCSVTSGNGHFATSHGQYEAFVVRLTAENLGLEENTSAKLKLFPNPAVDHITIENTSGFETQATIVDLKGNIVKSINLNQSGHDVRSLASGIYFVSLASKSGNPTFLRFVKK